MLAGGADVVRRGQVSPPILRRINPRGKPAKGRAETPGVPGPLKLVPFV
jgi:hypothetical protein